MFIVGVGFFVASAVLSYNKLYLTNERRFWLAIENGLRTNSVVKEQQQGGTGNKQIDRTRFSFGSNPQTNKTTSISDITATTKSNVITELLQTESLQFIRYTDITTDQTKEDGSDYDFSSIKNVWAKQAEATSEEEAEFLKNSYVQLQVTLVPFGNLQTTSRRSIVNSLRNDGVYDIDYKGARTESVDDIDYVIYPVKVMTKKYVAVLQKHFIAMGYGEFPPFNPDNYADNSRVNAQILVRKNDNVIAGITFNGITEKYTNYGVLNKVDLPKEYISVDELQENLGSLSN